MPHEWGVIGISREQWTLVAAALSLGGNVRVGLEDNFYLPDGRWPAPTATWWRGRGGWPRTRGGGWRRWPRRATRRCRACRG